MKVLFLFIQLGIISSHLTFAENTNSTQEWTITQHGPVLLMRIENRGGSAFLIKDNQHTLVVSNVHVVSGLMKGRDTLPPNIQMIGLDLLHDLVVLKIKGKFEDSEVLTLADSPLEANSQLTAIGFPKGRFSRIQGRLLPYDYDPNIKYMMTNYSHLSGASGSPILNSEQQVIGILYEAIDNLAIFSSLATIKNLLSTPPLNCEWKECLNNELKRLHLLAETDPIAQFQLGRLYLDGHIVPQDLQQAKKHMLAAADQGFAQAQHDIGMLQFQQQERILRLLRYIMPPTHSLKKSADQGFAPAQHKVSNLYRLRRIILQSIPFISKIYSGNLRKAVEGMLAAAEQNYIPAMKDVINIYDSGEGVTKDPKKVRKWEQKLSSLSTTLSNKKVPKKTSNTKKSSCANSF